MLMLFRLISTFPGDMKYQNMNPVKKILGVVLILMSALSVYYVLTTAVSEISAGNPEEAVIFWPVIIAVFVPIAIGLALFGYYSVKGEYDA